jgi:hypothetical protein
MKDNKFAQVGKTLPIVPTNELYLLICKFFLPSFGKRLLFGHYSYSSRT